MLNYTHKIQLMNGEAILITENQAEAIKQAVINGDQWIVIGKELVNPKAISKIGYHHATNEEKKQNENMIEMALIKEGRNDLVDMKRKLVKEKSIQHAIEKDKNFMEKLKAGNPEALKVYLNMPDNPAKPISEIESARGDAEYWVDEFGVKHFS